MTPTSDNPSPTPLHEPINAVIDATVKEEVQESSGPEARETPPRSSLLVNNGQSSITPWSDPLPVDSQALRN